MPAAPITNGIVENQPLSHNNRYNKTAPPVTNADKIRYAQKLSNTSALLFFIVS